MTELSIGETIKKLRRQKKLTQKFLYTNIISNSFVAVFRKGNYGIEADKLFKIFHRLNVTPDEFLYLRHNYQESSYLQTLIAIDSAYEKQDNNELENIFNNNIKSFDLQDKALGALAYLKIAVTGSNVYTMSFESIHFLSDYLDSLEKWTLFELRLFVEGIFV